MLNLINPKTIIPDIATPVAINGNAFLKGTANKKAATAPVQAPVKGKGIATKLIKAISPYLVILASLFLLVLSKSHAKKRLHILDFADSHLDTAFRKISKNITGTKFPITETKKAKSQFIL